MAEVVNSLFGITPESLQAQRNAALDKQAMDYAQLDPLQRASANLYAGANRLGGGIASLMGVQDPELARVTQRQALLRQAQPQDAAGWQALASQLWNSGDAQGAQQALAQSQALEKAAAELAYKNAQTIASQASATSSLASAASSTASAKKSGFDISIEGRAQDLARSGKYTADSVKAFKDNEGDVSKLVAIDKFTKPSADFISKAVELGFGDKPAYGGYTPEQTAKVNAALFREDLTKKAAGAQRTNVQVLQESELTKSNIKAFGDLRDAGIQAGKTLESVRTLVPLIDKSFAGFGSDAKLTAGQIAEALGVPIQGTSQTEQLRSLQNNLKIGNSTVLKGSLSDKDMAILGEAIGQGNTTRNGLKGIMKNIEKNALIDQTQYQKANAYQKEGKLSQYDFVAGSQEARDEVNAKLKRLADLERKARGQ